MNFFFTAMKTGKDWHNHCFCSLELDVKPGGAKFKEVFLGPTKISWVFLRFFISFIGLESLLDTHLK